MTDNKNVLQVLNGFLELSPAEKLEFKREIESAILEGVLTSDLDNLMKKRQIVVKMSSDLGPTNNNNCKCCGKG
jgi:hypothetical protein